MREGEAAVQIEGRWDVCGLAASLTRLGLVMTEDVNVLARCGRNAFGRQS